VNNVTGKDIIKPDWGKCLIKDEFHKSYSSPKSSWRTTQCDYEHLSTCSTHGKEEKCILYFRQYTLLEHVTMEVRTAMKTHIVVLGVGPPVPTRRLTTTFRGNRASSSAP
jgi:hypothetical protein